MSDSNENLQKLRNDFSSDNGWDTHVMGVISNGRKVNQLHSIVSYRNINWSA